MFKKSSQNSLCASTLLMVTGPWGCSRFDTMPLLGQPHQTEKTVKVDKRSGRGIKPGSAACLISYRCVRFFVVTKRSTISHSARGVCFAFLSSVCCIRGAQIPCPSPSLSFKGFIIKHSTLFLSVFPGRESRWGLDGNGWGKVQFDLLYMQWLLQ